MAAVADKSGEAVVAAAANNNSSLVVETAQSESKEFNVQKLVDMFTKLNPLAKEFFPSSYQTNNNNFNQMSVNKQSVGNENYSNRKVFFFTDHLHFLIAFFVYFYVLYYGCLLNFIFIWFFFLRENGFFFVRVLGL